MRSRESQAVAAVEGPMLSFISFLPVLSLAIAPRSQCVLVDGWGVCCFKDLGVFFVRRRTLSSK